MSTEDLLGNVRESIAKYQSSMQSITSHQSGRRSADQTTDAVDSAYVTIIRNISSAVRRGVSPDVVLDITKGVEVERGRREDAVRSLASLPSIYAAKFVGQLLDLPARGEPIASSEVEHTILPMVRTIYSSKGGASKLQNVFVAEREQGAAYRAIRGLAPQATRNGLLKNAHSALARASELSGEWSTVDISLLRQLDEDLKRCQDRAHRAG